MARDWAYLGFAALTFLLGLLSLLASVAWLAFAVAAAIDLYLILVLIELAMRRKSEKANARWLFDVPLAISSMPILALLVVANVCAFAQAYIASEGIKYVAGGEQLVNKSNLLTDKWDAVYFSTVTFTTLGYGDFVPVSRHARILVLWQLVTTVLFLLGMLPLIMSRLADFDAKGQSPG